jgi:hypothetical protein
MKKKKNPKHAVGALKPSTFNIPPVAILEMGMVMDKGAKEYGPFSWRHEPIDEGEYYNAIMRHLLAWRDGQEIDQKSSQPALAHVMAGCAILLDAKFHERVCHQEGPLEPGDMGLAARFIHLYTEEKEK